MKSPTEYQVIFFKCLYFNLNKLITTNFYDCESGWSINIIKKTAKGLGLDCED